MIYFKNHQILLRCIRHTYMWHSQILGSFEARNITCVFLHENWYMCEGCMAMFWDLKPICCLGLRFTWVRWMSRQPWAGCCWIGRRGGRDLSQPCASAQTLAGWSCCCTGRRGSPSDPPWRASSSGRPSSASTPPWSRSKAASPPFAIDRKVV